MRNHNKVISFPSKPGWIFEDFVYLNGNNPMQDWYDGLSEESQYMFNALLKGLAKTEKKEAWIGFRGFLKGIKEPIWEIGFKSDKRQYRVFGTFGWEKKRQVILLIGCYHKQKRYTPSDAIKLSANRYKLLKNGEAKTHARPITDDI